MNECRIEEAVQTKRVGQRLVETRLFWPPMHQTTIAFILSTPRPDCLHYLEAYFFLFYLFWMSSFDSPNSIHSTKYLDTDHLQVR